MVFLGRLYRILDDDTGETNFVYDGNELVAEYNGSGQLLRRYVHGASATADDPLAARASLCPRHKGPARGMRAMR